MVDRLGYLRVHRYLGSLARWGELAGYFLEGPSLFSCNGDGKVKVSEGGVV